MAHEDGIDTRHLLFYVSGTVLALIFSILTLVFITLAIESHHEEEGHLAEDVVDAIEGDSPKLQPA